MYQFHLVVRFEESFRASSGWSRATPNFFESYGMSVADIRSVSFTQPISDSLVSATRSCFRLISLNLSFVEGKTSNPACLVSLFRIFWGIRGSISYRPLFLWPLFLWSLLLWFLLFLTSSSSRTLTSRLQRPPAAASGALAPSFLRAA